MIQIEKNEIKRDGVQIGWIQGDHLFDRTGKKVALIQAGEVWNEEGKKVVKIEGDYACFLLNDTKVRLEDNNKLVGGVVSDACRAAVRLLLA